MAFLGNFQGGEPSVFTPRQSGLMANPSSMQFIQAMLNQPGGQYQPGGLNQPGGRFGAGAIPDYGTGMDFGVPLYYPPQMPFKNVRPSVAAAPDGSGPVDIFGNTIVDRDFTGSER